MTFFFTVIFMLLVFWRPQEWLIPWLYGFNLLDVIVVIATLALVLEVDAGRLRTPRRLPQLWILPGLWFAAIMSHVAHTYFAGMMWTIVPVFKICFLTFLLFYVLDRPRRLRTVAWVFVMMTAFMAVHALLQEHRGYGFAGQRPLYIPSYGGKPAHYRSLFFGIFNDPNDMGQMLATSIPLAFVLPKRMNFIKFILCSGVAALLVMGILTTHSGGTMVALAAVGSVMFALALPDRWLPTLLLALVFSAIALCPLSAPFLDEAAHDRVVFWGEANYAFKSSPLNMLFGVGYGMFSEYITKDRASHNAFVYAYTSLGLFGYWFWFNLLVLGVIGAWRSRVALRRTREPEQRWLRRFCGLAIAAMSGFAVSSYFLSRTFQYPFFFLFALLGVLPWVTERTMDDQSLRLMRPKKDLMWTTAGAFGSVLYIYLSIILLNKAFWG